MVGLFKTVKPGIFTYRINKNTISRKIKNPETLIKKFFPENNYLI